LRKLNILQVVARVPSPPVDGGALYVYHLSKTLLKAGHNVIMAGFLSNKHPQNLAQLDGVQFHVKNGEFKKYSPWAFVGSELRKLPVTVSHRMNKRIFANILGSMDRSVDVILLEGVFVAHFIDELRDKFTGVPIILRSSNAEFQVLERNAVIALWPISKIYARQARFMKDFEKAVMQKVDGISAITASDLALLHGFNDKIPALVNTSGASIPDRINEDRPKSTIGAIANWSWEPNKVGLSWFLDNCWDRLRQVVPDVRFEVAGFGMSDVLQAQLVAKGVECHGFVDDAEAFRQSISVGIIPLLSGGGMKIKTLEYMASRVPIVSTSIGIEGTTIEPSVHALIADDPIAFVEAVQKLLQEPDLASTLTQNAFELIKSEYSWDAKAEELLAFIDSRFGPF
jgi:polysaccharide biosynthesis protein PslH